MKLLFKQSRLDQCCDSVSMIPNEYAAMDASRWHILRCCNRSRWNL